MEIKYKIVQCVKSVRRGWNEPVFEGEIERIAFHEFEKLRKEFPNEYFELIKTEHKETCLKWT